MTSRAIAERIRKDPTTLSKEVKLRSRTHTNSFVKTDETCPNLLKAPYVCNGCPKRNHSNCRYPRRRYVAKEAQTEYETLRTESRLGVPLNRKEFYETERTISEAVRAGQHIYHAIQANHLAVSKSTVYRHIAKGYYSILPLDLPRAVKFKPRKQKSPDYVPKGVKGRIGGKVIMTFQFVNVDFMFGILLDNKTAAEAGSKIIRLKERLRNAGFCFGDVFPTVLADNGGEFGNVFAFEDNLDGQKETSLFFCRPNAPYEKPHVENNHIIFRDIVPKGTSFDDFTQDTVDVIFSHVNGVVRRQFNGKSAYDMFAFTYSAALATALSISYIPPKDVIQSPKLLKLLQK